MEDVYKLKTPEDYDLVVRAEIPDKIKEPDLHAIVVKHMIHGPCGDYNTTLPCMKTGECKRGFPKAFSEITKLGNDSYPVYRRREGSQLVCSRNKQVQLDNSWVVPYNPWMLKKYDCHINLEICCKVDSVKYLYKYVNKGADRVALEVRRGPDYNEVQQFVDGRWVSTQEAFWKFYKFPMSRMNPCVERLALHLPNQQQVRFNADLTISAILENENLSKTTLTQFFQLNIDDHDARQYLYREIPSFYRWCSQDKLWIKRRSNQRCIGRIYTVSPTEGERFYLRVLLNHIKGVKSFEHLLRVNGRQCSTFKEAAELRGLLEQDNSIRECLLEAANYRMPMALRRLFASILVYCAVTELKQLWDEFYPFMSEDYISSMGANDPRVLNRVLRDLDNVFQQNRRKISDFKDLPTFLNIPNDKSSIIEDERSIPVTHEDLNSVTSLNNDQHMAFTAIINAVQTGNSAIFFVDGPGGTGKTFLYRALLATIRKEGGIAIATASSGIVATLLPGGRTAHSRFKIPLTIQPSSTCDISKTDDDTELLRAAKIIIWDEAPMTHRHSFEAVNRTLIDILGIDLPFGGKIMVLGGDFRQVLPVIPKGTRAETVAASVVKSPIWKHVHVLRLTENMRGRNDKYFADFLLRVGDGLEPSIEDDLIKVPSTMVIPYKGIQSIDTLIERIYPNLTNHINDASYMLGRAIITPLNNDVNKINDRVIMKFPGEVKIYHSFDKVEDDTYNHYSQEFLNSISPSGMPPHVLHLKVGAPIMLLRNIAPSNGLCNGTRLICRSLNRNFIDAEILDGPYKGTRAFLHRIPLKTPDSMRLSFKMIRTQFPVRLSFALTINKSQGQTIPHVGVYLPDNVFSHGQLYVALSRGVSQQKTKVLVEKKTKRPNADVRTRMSDEQLLQIWDEKSDDEFFERQKKKRNKHDNQYQVKKNLIFSPGWSFSLQVDNYFLRKIIVKELISQLEPSDIGSAKVRRKRRHVKADKEMRKFYKTRTRRKCKGYRKIIESYKRWKIAYANSKRKKDDSESNDT